MEIKLWVPIKKHADIVTCWDTVAAVCLVAGLSLGKAYLMQVSKGLCGQKDL